MMRLHPIGVFSHKKCNGSDARWNDPPLPSASHNVRKAVKVRLLGLEGSIQLAFLCWRLRLDRAVTVLGRLDRQRRGMSGQASPSDRASEAQLIQVCRVVI